MTGWRELSSNVANEDLHLKFWIIVNTREAHQLPLNLIIYHCVTFLDNPIRNIMYSYNQIITKCGTDAVSPDKCPTDSRKRNE